MIIYSPRILANLQQEDSIDISFEELDKVELQLMHSKSEKKKNIVKKARAQKFKLPQSKFDPNTYLKSDWMNLGLSEKQANVILSFTRYGIESNEELRKIFVIPEELYELIKDSTFYPQKAIQKNGFQIQKTKLNHRVDLNSATHAELVALNGIGDFYAEKIIEYRTRLGGYISKEQLLEIWKFTPEKLGVIEAEIFINGETEKLSVNSASYEELSAHPYISFKVANSIVKMREQRDGFLVKTEILESKLIDKELYKKLEPYIKL